MHRVSRQNILNIKRAMNDGMFLRKQVNEIFKLDVVGDVLLKYPLKMLRSKFQRGYESNKLFYYVVRKLICFISLKIKSKLSF